MEREGAGDVNSKGEMTFLLEGKGFESVKDRIYDEIKDTHDLTLYSITAEGKTKPSHIVVKLTYAGHMDEYLSGKGFSAERALAMLRMTYGQGPYILPDYVKQLKEEMERASREGRYLLTMYSSASGEMESINVESFFDKNVDAQAQNPGERIYLKDKAFFLSCGKDQQHVKFSDLMLLGSGRKNVLTVDMSRADTGRIRDMSFMFSDLSSVKQLDLSGVDTGSATNMFCMFKGCSLLERLDLSAFSFTKVERSTWMFSQCSGLKEVILPESILQVGDVMHETEEMGKGASPYTSWAYGNAPIPEHELETRMVKVRRPITFGKATDRERREHLGLGPQTKITIVRQKQPKAEATAQCEQTVEPKTFMPVQNGSQETHKHNVKLLPVFVLVGGVIALLIWILTH